MAGGRGVGLAAVAVAGLCVAALGLSFAGAFVALSSPVRTASAAGPLVLDDVPADYLLAYQAASEAFALGRDGWAYLAAVGKVETDHGRLQAPGVLSGQNTHGCCAGPMQIHNGFGAGTGTWAQYRVDGDGDGRTIIYDVEDAVFTAARLERASGAPEAWRRAIFAYNHADWYVEKVVDQARRYLAAAAAGDLGGAGISTLEAPLAGTWLAPLPGFPGERCDRRIVRDVLWLVAAYGLIVSDCFGTGHAVRGEHPLGLAIDASPVDGDWRRTERLAVRFGWSPARRHGLSGPRAVPRRPLQRLSGPRRSAPFGSAAHTPLLAARTGGAVHGGLLGTRHHPTGRRRAMTVVRACADHDGARRGAEEVPMDLVLLGVSDVKLNPKPGGLPGSRVLQGLVDGLGFWALIAALAALIVGAAVWAWASQSNNHHYAANGRRATAVAAFAALIIGAAPALINFFAEAGEKVK
ncbi:MAG TPA: DUF6112 family protein [Solirubrobacteraceae bacterium]|jgi:hypothetical protein